MTDLKTLTKNINQNSNSIKSGALRFFGDWFGRPYDNVHRVVNAQCIDNKLIIYFDEEERLTIWSPVDVTINKDFFLIKDANHIKWEWYCYGSPKIPENLFYIDYQVIEKEISCDSNVDWYAPTFDVNIDSPAVEVV